MKRVINILLAICAVFSFVKQGYAFADKVLSQNEKKQYMDEEILIVEDRTCGISSGRKVSSTKTSVNEGLTTHIDNIPFKNLNEGTRKKLRDKIDRRLNGMAAELSLEEQLEKECRQKRMTGSRSRPDMLIGDGGGLSASFNERGKDKNALNSFNKDSISPADACSISLSSCNTDILLFERFYYRQREIYAGISCLIIPSFLGCTFFSPCAKLFSIYHYIQAILRNTLKDFFNAAGCVLKLKSESCSPPAGKTNVSCGIFLEYPAGYNFCIKYSIPWIGDIINKIFLSENICFNFGDNFSRSGFVIRKHIKEYFTTKLTKEF